MPFGLEIFPNQSTVWRKTKQFLQTIQMAETRTRILLLCIAVWIVSTKAGNRAVPFFNSTICFWNMTGINQAWVTTSTPDVFMSAGFTCSAAQGATFDCTFQAQFGSSIVSTCFAANIGFSFQVQHDPNGHCGWGWNSWTDSFTSCTSQAHQSVSTCGTDWGMWTVDIKTKNSNTACGSSPTTCDEYCRWHTKFLCYLSGKRVIDKETLICFLFPCHNSTSLGRERDTVLVMVTHVAFHIWFEACAIFLF